MPKVSPSEADPASPRMDEAGMLLESDIRIRREQSTGFPANLEAPGSWRSRRYPGARPEPPARGEREGCRRQGRRPGAPSDHETRRLHVPSRGDIRTYPEVATRRVGCRGYGIADPDGPPGARQDPITPTKGGRDAREGRRTLRAHARAQTRIQYELHGTCALEARTTILRGGDPAASDPDSSPCDDRPYWFDPSVGSGNQRLRLNPIPIGPASPRLSLWVAGPTIKEQS